MSRFTALRIALRTPPRSRACPRACTCTRASTCTPTRTPTCTHAGAGAVTRLLAMLMLAGAALLGGPAAQAQFAAAVNPPRFEVGIEPGQTSRQVLEITNAAVSPGTYRVYTADWAMDGAGALTFYDTIQPGSCRPWVSIERRDLTVSAGARIRYRFEVAPPADARPQECRFALMLESRPQEVATSEASSFPMSGRIAVIVYARVGGVRAQLAAGEPELVGVDNRRVPSVMVRNTGNATGRLTGIVKGRDAAGRSFELAPESVPILPGTTRRIALQPYEAPLRSLPGVTPAPSAPVRDPSMQLPLTLRGTLEYGPGGADRVELDGVYVAPALPAASAAR